jgi:hypothetical protein
LAKGFLQPIGLSEERKLQAAASWIGWVVVSTPGHRQGLCLAG